MILNEGVMDEIKDYLTVKGILKLKYRHRVITDGASNLNQIIGPLSNLKDDDLLYILKILKKRGNTEVFSDVGFLNSEHDTNEFTFLDLAITNKNYNSIAWIIENPEGFYYADVKSIKGFFKDTYRRYPEWIVSKGHKFLSMLINTPQSTQAKEAAYRALYELVSILFNGVIKDIKLEVFDKAIPFILNDVQFVTIMQKLIYSHRMIKSDDPDIYRYLKTWREISFDNYLLFRDSLKDGEIRKAIIADESNFEIIQQAVEACNLDIVEWVSDEAKDIFLF